MTQQTASIDMRLQARISEQPELAVSLLQQLLPPTSAIVVGVNRLNPVWLSWPRLSHDRVLLIDAQADRLQAVHQHLQQTRGWRTIEAVLDSTDATAPFHAMSHAGESGLLPDSTLQQLWPNIRSLHSATRPTQQLDTLLAGDPGLSALGEEAAGWLIVDCLPALRVLRGAAQHLQRCAVVAARVLVGRAAEAGIQDATLAELQSALTPLGFRHALSLEETHPDIVTAIFVRDGGSVPSEAIAERDAAVQARDQAIADRDAAIHARDQALADRDAAIQARDQALAERDALQDQVAPLQNEAAALSEQLKDLTHAWEMEIQAKTDAIAARDGERKATTEAMKARELALTQLQAKEAELSALTKEKAELVAARDEAVKALEAAIVERDAVLADHEAALKSAEKSIQQLTLERDEARQQLADQSERMQQLEAENAEAHRRHQLMQDEMVKAEAQIELIKDLLLREQGL